MKQWFTKMMKTIWAQMATACLVVFSTLILGLQGCGTTSDGFFLASMGLQNGAIFVANASGTNYTITVYDLNGNFKYLLVDTTNSAQILRGIAALDPFNIIVAMDTPDQLVKINTFTGKTDTFANSSFINGNIFQIATTTPNTYFIIETNNIEKFVGARRDPPSGNAYIPTTVGACTMSTPRGLAVNSAGNLLVTNTANNRVLLYNVSGTTATCLDSDASFGAQTPIPIVVHPNGNLYFGTQANDALYVAAEDLSNAPAIVGSTTGTLLNPTAMAVLPDGNLIMATSGTAAIVLIDPVTGTILNSAFIRDAFTTAVNEIYILPPQ